MKHSLFTMGIVAAALAIATPSCTTQQQPTEITWGTFNIRYDNPADSLNNWQYRKDNVAEFIKKQGIDIVGMQEVLYNQLEDLKSRLPEYAEVGVGREDGKTKGEYAPLFYKKDRFEVLDSNTFWLSQYPDSVGFIGWDGACTRIATWAKLKDKKNGKVFMAVKCSAYYRKNQGDCRRPACCADGRLQCIRPIGSIRNHHNQ